MISKEFSDEFVLEIQKMIKDEYKKAVSIEDATQIARHIVVMIDMFARNAKSIHGK